MNMIIIEKCIQLVLRTSSESIICVSRSMQCNFVKCFNMHYYMAGSASGKNEVNPVF